MAGSIILRSDFPPFMRARQLNALSAAFDQTLNLFEQMRGEYYNTSDTKDPYYSEFGMVGLGMARLKHETTPAGLDRPALGRPYTMVFPTYSLAVAISEEAQEDDTEGKLMPMITKELGRSIVEAMEEDAVSQFNNGFSAQGWEADGVALFSTSHPLIRGSGTSSNASATAAALSITSLDAAMTTLRTTRNDTGRWMSEMMPKKLHVHPALLPDALRIIRTSQVLGSNYNDVNLYYKTLEAMPNPRFSSTTRWFLAADNHKWLWKNRRKARLVTDVDEVSGVTVLQVSARWGRGASDWRGYYGSNAS